LMELQCERDSEDIAWTEKEFLRMAKGPTKRKVMVPSKCKIISIESVLGAIETLTYDGTHRYVIRVDRHWVQQHSETVLTGGTRACLETCLTNCPVKLFNCRDRCLPWKIDHYELASGNTKTPKKEPVTGHNLRYPLLRSVIRTPQIPARLLNLHALTLRPTALIALTQHDGATIAWCTCFPGKRS
jgi:hypothetical protein